VNIRDRIKELRRVPADQLQPNPKNWRKHPESQANALRGVLAEVGIASAVLARETPEGGLMLIDGHLRTEDAGITPPDFEPASIDDQGQLDQKAPITCPHCNREFVPK
jgi:hypothetical protein